MESTDKARRQREILAVLAEESIGTQDALRKAVKRRGYPVTQATLSRDLQELKIARVPGSEGYRYVAPGEAGGGEGTGEAAPARLRSVASLEVTRIDSNEVAVIIRTLTGRAQGVAVWLDGQKLEDLLATVAGDDTIIAIPRSIKRTERLREELSRIFGLVG